MKNKRTINLKFYEQKWFTIICFFALFGWLFYKAYPSFKINKNELIELDVTVYKEWKRGERHNPFKLYFNVKEYSNRFGIYVGGIYGRWTEVTQTLHPNAKVTIRIHESNIKKLNNKTDAIPIYYLKNENSDIIFNEDGFNNGEKSSDNRLLALLIVLFILGIWKILS